MSGFECINLEYVTHFETIVYIFHRMASFLVMSEVNIVADHKLVETKAASQPITTLRFEI